MRTVTGLLLGVGLPSLLVLRMLWRGRGGGIADRRGGVEGLLGALAGLLLAWLWVSWDVVPRLVYALPVALTVYGLLLLGRHWARLPWVAGAPRGWKLANTGVAAVVGVGMALVLR